MEQYRRNWQFPHIFLKQQQKHLTQKHHGDFAYDFSMKKSNYSPY
jgi:hypothetical protein